MSAYRVATPVVFIIYNRPECTRRVFTQIADVKPRRLFVIADGPRPDVPGDADKCCEVRRIVESLDWSCRASFDYADFNLGCRRRISAGLERVFDAVERAIVIEDDCLPSRSFFRYCDGLLEKYADDPRVMMVSGSNLLGETETVDDYLFTMHGTCWGWATWKRAWSTYDVDIGCWPERKPTRPFRHLPFERKEIVVFERTLDDLRNPDPRNRAHDAWDYQWDYNRYVRGGLAITPRVNLVTNIGFGEGATHTRDAAHKLAALPRHELSFPLIHPDAVEVSLDYERAFAKGVIRKSLPERGRNFVRRAKRFVQRARAG